jgi:hypothetical protein
LHDDEDTSSAREEETMDDEDTSRNLLPLEIVYEDPIVREIRLIKTQNDSMTGRKVTRRRLRQNTSELANLAAVLGATSSKQLSLYRSEPDDVEKPPRRSDSSASSKVDPEDDNDSEESEESAESEPESDTGPRAENQ